MVLVMPNSLWDLGMIHQSQLAYYRGPVAVFAMSHCFWVTVSHQLWIHSLLIIVPLIQWNGHQQWHMSLSKPPTDYHWLTPWPCVLLCRCPKSPSAKSECDDSKINCLDNRHESLWFNVGCRAVTINAIYISKCNSLLTGYCLQIMGAEKWIQSGQ